MRNMYEPHRSVVRSALYTALACLAFQACGGDSLGSETNGTLRVYASGGNEAREGIAAAAFDDGFVVQIDHAVLAIQEFELGSQDGDDARVVVEPVLVELVPQASLAFEIQGVRARRWDRLGWTHAPPEPGVRVVNDVAPSIVERMIAERYSFYLEGTLFPPTGRTDAEGEALAPIPFELGFPVMVRYFRCTSGVDGSFGTVIPRNGVQEVEITWHLTHAFFDSYAEESALRAEAMAAMWDGSNPLTLDDLAAQPLANLRGLDGNLLRDADGYPVLYIPPRDADAETLRDFVLSARFGHFNGLEGFCMTELEPLP